MALDTVQASSRRKISICSEVSEAFINLKTSRGCTSSLAWTTRERKQDSTRCTHALLRPHDSDFWNEAHIIVESFDFNFHCAGKVGGILAQLSGRVEILRGYR